MATLSPETERDVLLVPLNPALTNFIRLRSNSSGKVICNVSFSPKPLGPGVKENVYCVYSNATKLRTATDVPVRLPEHSAMAYPAQRQRSAETERREWSKNGRCILYG
eukprot:1974716-Rhodomonas_salina.1